MSFYIDEETMFMNINLERISITFDESELYIIAFALKDNIVRSIETNWVNRVENRDKDEYKNYVLEKVKKEFCILESFSNILNRRHILDYIYDAINSAWEKSEKK
jgi:hypothetical protein